MSNKDEAYELFAQGKEPGDIEVMALDIEESTLNEYYQDWLKSQEPEPEPEQELEPEQEPEPNSEELVEVVSLEPLQLFSFKRHKYGKHRVHNGGVTCVSKEGDKVITLSPDTLVKPI